MNVVDRATGQSQADRSARGNRWWLVLLLLLLLGMCGLAGTLFGQRRSNAAEPEFIPVSLHSSLEADYRANPTPPRLPGVRLEIIWDVIYDRDPGATDLEARKTALLTSLQTPVPVVTPPACQGQHVIYASRDTWIDSANPTAAHGADTRLHLGRAGDGTQQLLLYFPLAGALPAGSFIDSARLELEGESDGRQLPPRSIQIYNLAAPFSEMATTWANRPEPYLPYRSLELARAAIDTWDVTDIVQDWLLDYHQNAGILLLPSTASTDFRGIYFSREAGAEVNYGVSGQTDRPGPRLIIDCGDLPPEPEAVAVAVVTSSPTPTPIPTNAQAGPTPPTSPPLSTATPILPLPTQPAPEPTLPASLPSAIPPSPSPLPPEPTLPPPSPTSPPPTAIPPDDDSEDDDPADEPDPPAPTITINDVAVTETDSGRVNATFNVTLSAAASGQVTVDFAVAGNTATAGIDFDGSSGALTFPPGSTRQTITVPVLGDLLDEYDETFFVNLANARGATLGDSQGRGTITDDDPPPALTIADVAVAEGDAGTVEALFTVSLSAASGLPVTAAYNTANGSAVAGDDYQSDSGFLSFPPGTISQTLPVRINGDLLFEPNETFLVNLSNATNATIDDDQAVGTILNDDGLTISIADVTVTEGSGGAVDAIFVVNLSTASAQPVTVEYATADDTASSPADYTAIPLTTLTFDPGVTTQTITVTIQSDLMDEPDETFFVNLSNPSSGTLFDDQGLGTIVDDDIPPALTINDVTVTEGDSGTTDALFTVSLNAPSGLTVTVDVATADNTAIAGLDYTSLALTTLAFDPGVTTQPVTVTVLGDLLDELDETFFINLSNPSNASIGDGQGLGTIIDDDGPCSAPDLTLTATADTYLRSNQAAQNYGSDPDLRTRPLTLNPRNTLIQFDLDPVPPDVVVTCAALFLHQTSSPDSGQSIQVHRVTNSWAETEATWDDRLSGIAWDSGGGDYDPAIEASFVPSTTNHAVNVAPLTQFWVDNPGANFGLLLAAMNNGSNTEIQYASRNVVTPTLRPKLVIEYIPTMSIDDVAVTEGDSGPTMAIFTVTLSTPGDQTITVDYATSDGTATTSGNDYLSASGAVTFAPGVTTQNITVTVIGDTLDETNETFTVTLSNPVNAGITDGDGLGTITDDDTAGQTLEATEDAWIEQGNPDTAYPTDDELKIDPAGVGINRAVIKFDLSLIPTGSTVVNAALELTVEGTQSGQTVHIYRLTRAWSEPTVTWNSPWLTTGGDYDPAASGSYNPADPVGTRVISLTTLVQGWVDGTYDNYGLILIGAGDSGASTIWDEDAGNGNGPRLNVEYNELGGLGLAQPPGKALPNSQVQPTYLPLILKQQAN